MAKVKKSINSGVAYYMPFPTRLRELLDTPGETQGKLADAVGVNRQSIGQWKDGITSPDINALNKIADYYNVSSDYLLGRTDVKFPDIEMQAIHEITGLPENAIKNICAITSMMYNYKETFDEETNKVVVEFTKEPKDILSEILQSEGLMALIHLIAKLSNDYFSIKEIMPLFKTTNISELPSDISSRYGYKLWLTNIQAQELISMVIEKYYLNTKDGVNTYRIELSKDEHKIIASNEPSPFREFRYKESE